ncbi:hypothetical protein EMIT0373P_10672 [Pseudomonas chlororaphis]
MLNLFNDPLGNITVWFGTEQVPAIGVIVPPR